MFGVVGSVVALYKLNFCRPSELQALHIALPCSCPLQSEPRCSTFMASSSSPVRPVLKKMQLLLTLVVLCASAGASGPGSRKRPGHDSDHGATTVGRAVPGTNATRGAKLGGRLGRTSAADAAAVTTRKPKAPHCRDSKAGCTHATKQAARKAAKLSAAEQAEARQKTNTNQPTSAAKDEASAAAVPKQAATETLSTAAAYRQLPMRAKVAAARAAATWRRFDDGHEDRSGRRSQHRSQTEGQTEDAGASIVRTSQGPHRHLPHGNHGSDRRKNAPQAVSLFGPGAFYP